MRMTFERGKVLKIEAVQGRLFVTNERKRTYAIKDPSGKLYRMALRCLDAGDDVIWVTATHFDSAVPIPILGTHELTTMLNLQKQALDLSVKHSEDYGAAGRFMLAWYKQITHFAD